MNHDRIEFANSLRGFAALAVACGHLIGLFWLFPRTVSVFTGTPEMVPILPDPMLSHIVLWPVNLGVLGVAIFFLISGMVIPISLSKSSWLRFLAARVMRLFPTYAACFTIVLCAIWLGTWYFHVPWPLQTRDIIFHFVPGLRALAGTRHIDSVVWTLEVELCFYVVCAMAVSLFRRNSLFIFAIPIILAVAASAQSFFPPLFIISIAPYLTFMFVGVAFFFLHTRRISALQAITIFGIVVASTIVAWVSVLGLNYLFDIGRSYLVGLFVFTFCYRFPGLVPHGRFVRFMANISYPFYLVHAVPGYALMRIIANDAGMPRTFAILSAFALAISIAAVIHYAIEIPTRRLSGRIQTDGHSAKIMAGSPPIISSKASAVGSLAKMSVRVFQRSCV
ncbi:acyltransferase [Mesorhizobium sp. M00.F.Ca.ET.217.01.1.1]|uniref:acyltransferase family protein n=1 Tax=Mesorhizobium sp. M00.F.Ca.ET.217.01.1.1 TaxID=2500529 RepID=UPI000FD99282|nr:acyltransferase [Mesorhizobium sp. M00.F.Ca.ET.217.01.1.1]